MTTSDDRDGPESLRRDHSGTRRPERRIARVPATRDGRTVPIAPPPAPASTGRGDQDEPALEGPVSEGWAGGVAAVRGSVHLRESILRSVMSSMAFEGFEVDPARSESLFDRALDGPPLEYPGDE